MSGRECLSAGAAGAQQTRAAAKRWRRRTSLVSFWTQSYILRDPHAPPCVRARMRASAHCHAAGAAARLCFGLWGRAVRAVAPRRDGRDLEVRLFGTVGTTVERRGAHSGGIERFCDVFTFGSLSRQCRAWMTKCVTPAHGAGRAVACAVQTQPPARRRPNARASSPADPPCGSTVHRRANVRFDHAAEGNAAEPHRGRGRAA